MKVSNNLSNKHSVTGSNKLQIRRMYNPIFSQKNQDSVSFKGIDVHRIIPQKFHKIGDEVKYAIHWSASILGVENEIINKNLKSTTPIQKKFFANMVESYNANNFYLEKTHKEDPQIIFDLLRKINNLTLVHCNFISDTSFSLTEIKKIMESFDYKSKSIETFLKILKDLSDSRPETKKRVLSIINSKNKDDIINDYPKYRAFLKRHFNEENMIQNLDNQIANGTFNPKRESQKYNLEERAKYSGFQNIIDVEKLSPFSSKESNSMLDIINNRLNPAQLKNKSDYKKNLEEIYTTTNKQNIDARLNYIRSYYHTAGIQEYKSTEMTDINALFKRMDENPQVMKFVNNISVRCTNAIGAGEILKIIDSVDIKKLELYKQKIKDIMPSKDINPMEKMIRYCRLQPDTQLGKIKKGIQFHLERFANKMIKKLPK